MEDIQMNHKIVEFLVYRYMVVTSSMKNTPDVQDM